MGLIPTPNTGTQGLNQTDQNAVQTVADNIVDVSTVADALDAGTIDAVVDDKVNIGTVSENIGNINSLALIDQELKTLAGDLSNIDLVAANIAEIGNVSINMATLLLLHTRMADLLGIASSLPNIDAVAANEANVNSVAINIPDIINVVSHMGDIHYVAQNSTAIETLYTSIDGIIAIAANPDAITTVADNIDVIIDASTYVSAINDNLVKIEVIEANVIALEASATTSASNASTSETNASSSASASATSALDADTHADRAEAAKSAAVISETNAATSETNAATSASNAATSESNALTSANNSATSASNASTSASNAATSESNASASASASANSAINAATSEVNAANSATSASNSAGNAANSESNAFDSESAAASSATQAQVSKNAASASASLASDSANDASVSESKSKLSETNAATSASSASQSEINAQTAKTQSENARDIATQKASDASDSEVAADGHRLASESSRLASESARDISIIARDKSQKWAEELEDTEVESGKYSSLHWAMKAQQWAQTVSNSLMFRGGWDASSGIAPTPSMAPETADYYKITVAGTVNSIDYSVGDNIIWDTVNDVWFKVDNTDSVLTVNGKKGAVTLTDLDILGFLSSAILRNDQSGSIAGTLTSTGNLIAGSGSGGVALTVNDGYGNANVTWNHQEGRPEQDGNAARIEVNTDSSSGAYMSFELKSGVTESQSVSLTTAMTLYEDRLDAIKLQEGGTDLASKYLGISSKAADSEKLDNLDSSQFIRSDTSDVKSSGTLRFNDNVYLTIGTGNDVEHFWNGSNYYTDINGGANWYLRDGNSSNATRFTFDIDTGNFSTGGTIYEAGTALSSKYLGLSAKAADSNLLDGLDSSAFIRANASDNVSGHTEWQDNYQVRLGADADFRMYHNGSHNYFDMYTGNLYIRDSTTNRFTFDDAGHFTATGNITAYSDIRVKTDIQTITDALAKVSLLNGVTFLRTDTDKLDRQTGLIAQHVKQVLPEAVQELENGDLTVAYGNMVGLLVESIKELNAKLELLKQEIESLRLERTA